MLRGSATARVDDKGRLKIPAEFLDTFLGLCGPERRVFITSRNGRSALVYPLPVWEAHERKLAEQPSTDPLVQKYLLTVSYWGKESQVDAAGRILLHPRLRAYAKIEGETEIYGKSTTLEITDHEVHRVNPPQLTDDDLARLSPLGI